MSNKQAVQSLLDEANQIIEQNKYIVEHPDKFGYAAVIDANEKIRRAAGIAQLIVKYIKRYNAKEEPQTGIDEKALAELTSAEPITARFVEKGE